MIKLSKGQSFFFFALSSLLLCILFWITLLPVKLGGWVTYVIVDGISMEPGFHLGDLVLVRTQPNYGVGDAVVYNDPNMGSYVFHRIIGLELNRFILQGDNNSWLDSYQPTQTEVIGKLWVHIPKAGKLIEWVREPLHMALAIGLLGVILMLDIFKTPSQNKKENPLPAFNFTGMSTLFGFGFFALMFLLLGIYSFIRPLNRPTENVPYQQEGTFYYSATGTPGVYDTDVVRSGEPVFPKLTCYLNIGFTYNILSNNLQGVAGKQSMHARISDQQSGWQRTIPLTAETVFSGNSYFATTVLDLCQVESIVTLVEQEAGLKQIAYTLEIISDASFTANVNGVLVSDAFSPKLTFKYDKIHFYLAEEGSQPDPLHSTQAGMAGTSASEKNTFSVLGFQIPVWVMRFVALLGFALSAVGLAYFGLNMYRATSQNQQALIRLKYGGMLIDVYEQNLAPASSMIDVQSIDDLARLAERNNTMMLHMTRNFLHYYFVQINATTYRYVVSTGEQGVEDEVQVSVNEIEKPIEPTPIELPVQIQAVEEPKKEPAQIVYVYSAPTEAPEPVFRQTEIVKKQPVIKEVETEYVIRTGKIEFDFPVQETLLPKIRL